jgi:2-oxoglutarate dehydrogenase E2 component (dihydrolipoamide succinyltransferase)
MATQVLMPSLGESVEEGLLTKWLKEKGEKVEEFEPLLEVNTDKVDTEVPSPASGVLLKILVEENSTVAAGQPLAWIGEPGEETPTEPPPTEPAAAEEGKSPPEAEPAKPAPQRAASREPIIPTKPGRHAGLGFISPVVAKMAGEADIDLSQVQGSGGGGRITKKDILTFVEKRGAGESAQFTTPSAPDGATPSEQPSAGDILPLNPVRRAIANHMVQSKHTSPHVTTVMEVDLSAMIAHRNSNKEAFARDGVRLTFTPYFTAAAVAALKAYPIVNSSWSEEGIILHKGINIGMATSLGEEGLIVPVIKNADTLSLLGLAQTVNDLAGRARAKQLQPEEVQGGTFTITNHGISGSLFASPIINQPQCAILGVGAIQKRVVVLSDDVGGDTIAIRPMAYISLTFDHRILDGAIGDYFLGKIVETLQEWD